MTGVQRVLNYCRQNPIAVYLVGGVLVHFARSMSVNAAYNQNFAKYDVERYNELAKFLQEGKK